MGILKLSAVWKSGIESTENWKKHIKDRKIERHEVGLVKVTGHINRIKDDTRYINLSRWLKIYKVKSY